MELYIYTYIHMIICIELYRIDSCYAMQIPPIFGQPLSRAAEVLTRGQETLTSGELVGMWIDLYNCAWDSRIMPDPWITDLAFQSSHMSNMSNHV